MVDNVSLYLNVIVFFFGQIILPTLEKMAENREDNWKILQKSMIKQINVVIVRHIDELEQS